MAVGAARPADRDREPAGPGRQHRRRSGGAVGGGRLHAYLFGPNNAINATFYNNLSFDIVKDLQHVAALVTMPNVMAVHPSVPAKTVAEFIAYAKANPGKVNSRPAGWARRCMSPASCSSR